MGRGTEQSPTYHYSVTYTANRQTIVQNTAQSTLQKLSLLAENLTRRRAPAANNNNNTVTKHLNTDEARVLFALHCRQRSNQSPRSSSRHYFDFFAFGFFVAFFLPFSVYNTKPAYITFSIYFFPSVSCPVSSPQLSK